MNVKVLAPAKINLGLEIGNKNSDGYHEVDMIMQSVSIYDEIKLSMSVNKNIEIVTDKKVDCPPEKNIAYRAAKEFFDYTKTGNCGVKIKIKKNIPMCAGLAGGSADGAGVIVGLDKMFGTDLKAPEMCKIGAKIGSDVPFCIFGGTVAASGIGVDLNTVSSMPRCSILVIKPGISISTAEAYSKFDSIKIDKKHGMDLLESSLKAHDLQGVCSHLYNRFEEVIDNPEIFDIKQKLKNGGALSSLMTGSGSAVYGIFDDVNKATKCMRDLKNMYEFVRIAEPINHGAVLV